MKKLLMILALLTASSYSFAEATVLTHMCKGHFVAAESDISLNLFLDENIFCQDRQSFAGIVQFGQNLFIGKTIKTIHGHSFSTLVDIDSVRSINFLSIKDVDAEHLEVTILKDGQMNYETIKMECQKIQYQVDCN